jgi:hypothetical protein
MAPWLNYLRLLWPARRAEWSIGIYQGTSPFDLAARAAIGGRPALTRKSLGNTDAHGVADPFMIACGREWLMFLEVENRTSGKGEIGLARSADAAHWRFEGIVLREPFHLSYPHVFEWEGSYYMLPECAASGTLRLYKADAFPARWSLHAVLLHAELSDATPFRHDGKWWLVALEGFRRTDAMVIYHADQLEGPWLPHISNPISAGNCRSARPAGRVIRHQGHLVRLAQDYEMHYGRSVRAYLVEELTVQSYRDRPALENDAALLDASGQGWNATGMHHMDAHELEPGCWIACVDGRRTVWHWPVWDRVRKRVHAAGERARAQQ